MRILVTGAGGMLGSDVLRTLVLRRPPDEIVSLTHADLDVTDAESVREAVRGADVIVNCAAYTRVDDAEDEEDRAFAINALGARNVAGAAAVAGARLIHLSTDYVFDGRSADPYQEGAPLDPVSAYGRTKAAGERYVRAVHPGGSIVLRTAWLYGAGGPNFVTTMLRRAATGDTVTVVDDQIGQPTWSVDVAGRIAALISSPVRAGVLHATSAGRTSWFGLAQQVFQLAGHDPARVYPAASAQFPRRAQRPRFSVLGHDGWGGTGVSPIRDWRVALADALGTGTLE